MKVLMLWKYYPQYHPYFYEKHPFVVDLPFEEHRNKILDDHFGWPGDLSKYMNQDGIQTEFIIVNAKSLQKSGPKKMILDHILQRTGKKKLQWSRSSALVQIFYG